MNELEEIRTFVQLVDSGSSTRAAELRGLAVSAISRRMKELESRLGVQLIQRTTRRMHLTEAGRLYYDRCTQLLADLAEAEAEVTERGKTLRGRLKIAAPVSFGTANLAPAIAAFMHAHPMITIDLDMSDRRVDLVEEGFDLAVRVGELADSSLKARRIADVRHVVCAAPSFFDKYGRPTKPCHLKGMPGLCYGNLQYADVWRYRAPDGSKGSVRVDARLTSTNGEALCEAAIAGLGVLCEPSFIVHGAVERQLIEPALIQYRWYDMGIYAVFPSTRYLLPKVRAFIDFLADRFGPDPYWDGFLKS